jgi:putative ABC transport system permease protein
MVLLLLWLFPAGFRERFGAEMIEQVKEDYGRARARGALPVAWFALLTVLDLLRSGVAEHLNPSGVAERKPKRGGRHMFQQWARDLRQSLRSLKRSPGFTAVTVGTLGLAIGANAGMFSVVNTVLVDPLPYGEVDRVVHIAGSAPGSQFAPEFGIGPEFFVQYRERSRLLEEISTYNSFTSTLKVDDRVERIRMSWPTNSLFSVLGARPMLGRLPVAEDGENVVVISHRLWTSWFGRDSSVIGRTVDVSFAKRTIIGVMKPEFQFPNDGALLWISSVIRTDSITPSRIGSEGEWLVARMKPGATPDAVARELSTLARELPGRFGGSPEYVRMIGLHRPVVRPIEQQLLGSVSGPLWVLLGAVGIVLLIACANVANLFLVRSERRQRDLAVRRAVGAGRGQLIRSQMAEAVIVAGLAGIVAVGLAQASLPALLRAAPAGIPRLDEVGLSATTLLFTLGVAVLSALACGLLPAIRASAPDLARLKEGGRGSTRRRHRIRDALVVGQTALALVLLIGSGLLVRSFGKLSNVDPGYDTRDLFTFQLGLEGSFEDGLGYAQFHRSFMDRIAALPGVTSVGIVENVPLNEGTRAGQFRGEEPGRDAEAGTTLQWTYAAGDYFRTMGIAVFRGRPLLESDQAVASGTVVISQSAANRLWPGQDPLGRRMQRQGGDTWVTVVGVVEDVMQDNFREEPEAVVYYPIVGPTAVSWRISSPAYVVKTPRAESIGPEIRALAKQAAPQAPMYRVFTMEGLAADSMVGLSFTMLTLGIVSALALILGAVGLYGVLSYVVAERTVEIGVRMALGAEARQVRRMVVVQGARVVAVGVAIGIAVAVVSTRALRGLLYGVPANDLGTFVGMSASMILIGILASYLPARRASRVDPIESLRGE